ncbi:MAG TPA: sodium-translocating pyrophosphatase [Actinomycetota bacterium]|nr:sodium-translocating pyrophosphatase [Actinomycetota bacterium]
MSEAKTLDIELSRFDITSLWIILVISLLALAFAWYLVRQVLAKDEGTETMQEISLAIREGARAYLARQFKTLRVFVALLTLILLALPAPDLGIKIARSIAFVAGAGFSALTGYVGMSLAVRANVRVASAARRSYREAMTIAFRAGGVAGMFTVGLGLLGATAIFLGYQGGAPQVLVGFGFGGALLAMFMRVGGGIFTKAADVGADLVGKVEQNIPEDDPRNAAVIADNVGDNVGDCAGMAADLFESYEVTLVASLILGFFAFGGGNNPRQAAIGVMFPLFVRAIGVITSMIGIQMVRPRSEDEYGMKSINRGFFVSGAISAVAVMVVAHLYVGDLRVGWAVIFGLLLSAAIQVLTEHYTSTKRKPVQEIAASTQTGPATTILSGFSVGLESTVYSILVIAAAIAAAFFLGGGDVNFALYSIALTGMGMLTTVGVIVSMDTYGPISDNAHGIAEMSGGLGGRADEIMANLDAVGNTTKAITKGMAIATAVIAATSLFGSFRDTVRDVTGRVFSIPIDEPLVLVGLLIGGAVPFMFSALTIRAVERAAARVVHEVRRQFREHPGIMNRTEKPDYARVVDIVTGDSLRELATPGLLAVLTPIAVGFALGAAPLGAFLAGVILTGQLLAVQLSNAGGAWDNAKKLIEEGHYGGKGSDAHKASVIGDTVGDPFKDTAGPALNPLIKVMNLVALLIAGQVVHFNDDPAVRALVAGVAVVGIVVAVAVSKARKSGILEVEPPAPGARPTGAPEGATQPPQPAPTGAATAAGTLQQGSPAASVPVPAPAQHAPVVQPPPAPAAPAQHTPAVQPPPAPVTPVQGAPSGPASVPPPGQGPADGRGGQGLTPSPEDAVGSDDS